MHKKYMLNKTALQLKTCFSPTHQNEISKHFLKAKLFLHICIKQNTSFLLLV